jgi:hypothetical protein
VKALRVLLALVCLIFGTATTTSAATAADLNSSTNGVLVDPTQDSAKIDYSLPSSVTLGANDSVNWTVTSVTTADVEGNVSTDDLLDSSHGALKVNLSPFGRKASLDFSSDFAGVFNVTVSASVANSSFSNTQKVTFSVSPKRTTMSYSNGKTPTIQFDSPDVGNDLQTVIRFKVNWTRTVDPKNMPDGPYWVYMWTVDSQGNLVRQPWNEANPNTKIFWNDPQLNQSLSTGTDWINLPVKYSDWLSWGGVHVKVWWYITDPQRGDHYIGFQKIFDIPVNFPAPKPRLSVNCGDIYLDRASQCNVQLEYGDALGNSTVGPNQQVTWQLADASSTLTSGTSINLANKGVLTIPVPAGSSPLTLSTSIDGTSISSKTLLTLHDYQKDLLDSLSLTKSCPVSFNGSSFKCTVTLKATTLKPFSTSATLEESVDGSSWKTVKKVSIASNSSVSVVLPANNKKSLSVRASVQYLGKKVVSDTQDWVVSSPTPATAPKSGGSTSGSSGGSTHTLSAGDKKACSYYQSAMAQGMALPFGSSKLHYILSAGYQAALDAATNPTLKLDFRIMLDASNGSGINSTDAQFEIVDYCG